MKIPPFTEEEAEDWTRYHAKRRRAVLKRKGPDMSDTLMTEAKANLSASCSTASSLSVTSGTSKPSARRSLKKRVSSSATTTARTASPSSSRRLGSSG